VGRDASVRADRGARPCPGRFRWRQCLRRHCDQGFLAGWWNERYCGELCRKLVRRWQDLKRQRKRRENEEAREKDRQAAAERRRDKKGRGDQGSGGGGRGSARPRCHADLAPGAPLCDRPGCYDPPGGHVHDTRAFCSAECRNALRRVEERERKWLVRWAKAGVAWCQRKLDHRRVEHVRRREARHRNLLRHHRPRGPPS
jgi:predicted nucleic acid-binding Zn ribbon protein